MSLNELLFWLSCKKEGSTPQFQTGIERLHHYISNQKNDPNSGRLPDSTMQSTYLNTRFAFEGLAHVDFMLTEADKYRWRIVPPTIALNTSIGGGWTGILCGARTPQLIEHLKNYSDIEWVQSAVVGMPDLIRINSMEPRHIFAAAQSLNLRVQDEASHAILLAIPPVHKLRGVSGFAIPDTPGWTIQRFSASQLQWLTLEDTDKRGLSIGFFRFLHKHQRLTVLRTKFGEFRVSSQVGKFIVLGWHKRRVLQYAGGKLSLPLICRPPTLVERALILCTGKLPNYNASNNNLEYHSIPPSIARLAAQSLSQVIR